MALLLLLFLASQMALLLLLFLAQEAVDGARSDAGGHGSDTRSGSLRTDGRDELGHPEAMWLD